MASTRELINKQGQRYYEIIVSMGKGKPQLTSKWYPQKGWSQKTIDRELLKAAAEFERLCKAGEIVSRKESRERERQSALEAAQIKTLRQYGETVYMPALTVRCAETTRSSYQGNLDNWIYPALGDIKMPEITTAQIEALLTSMQAQGKSHGTVIKVYTVLQGVFKKAYKTDVIDRNPMDKVERPKPRKDENTTQEAAACTTDEIIYLWDCLEKEPLKWRALVRLLIDTGMRRGECCGLRWKDVDFKNNTVTISGNLCYTPEKGVYMDTPKNRKFRIVDVDPAVMALLRQLRQDQAKTTISQYVFTKEGSAEPMHPQSPTGYLGKFQKKYGIDHLHPHKLRHSFASIAITSGADVASVSEKIGHADKAITLRMYTHSNPENIRKISQIFRNAIQDSREKAVKNA